MSESLINTLITGTFGLIGATWALWFGHRLNQVHVLVNSRLTEALTEIKSLKAQLETEQ